MSVAALYARACDGGVASACFNEASLYDGLDLPRDPVRALALYQRACDGGEPAGCEQAKRLHDR